MTGFTGPLVIKEISSETWQLVEPFTFVSVTGLVVDVPQGFETDLASVPKILRSIVPQIGYWNKACVCHDYLYRLHSSGTDTTVTRLQADNLLLEGCRVSATEYGVPDNKKKNFLIYGAVRIGGESSWLTPEEKAEKLDKHIQDDYLD